MQADADEAGRKLLEPRITREYLARLARLAGLEDALAGWQHEPVHGGFGGAIGGTALYRFRLTMATGQAHSLILKILFQRPGETPQSPYYWKREYEIYRAGFLAQLPSEDFRLPRIYLTEERGDACWIWMQDIEDRGGAWSLEDFADFAERLGRFNGSWQDARKLPRAQWLARGWHSAIVPALGDTFAELEQLLSHPLARIALPYAAKDEILALWRDRELFRRALAQLPRTFCHNDAFRRNVLRHGQDHYLIDWALAGVGGLGEDLVSLVAVSLYYEGFTQEYAIALDRAVFAGYMRGLRAVGWRGDEGLARIGYTCGMTLRGLAGVKQDINQLIAPANHAQVLANHHLDTIEEVAAFFAEVRRFRLLRMAREARALLKA